MLLSKSPSHEVFRRAGPLSYYRKVHPLSDLAPLQSRRVTGPHRNEAGVATTLGAVVALASPTPQTETSHPCLDGTSPEVHSPFSAICSASPFLGPRNPVNRSRVFLAHDLSVFSVSHALDGFLLAEHHRFISPGRHSWDFPPSELFPLTQP